MECPIVAGPVPLARISKDRGSIGPAMLPVVWTLFAVLAVGGFLMIAAYWLDVQERPDLRTGERIGWVAALLVFPIAIPAYAFLGGAGWPAFLRAASIVPAVALGLFFGFVFEAFR